ncbi:CDP-alcohol phosphatidyltransferase family protein [Paenibacillus sp. M1]|uniref:CDP-alcohol phosphatidyltransferase family protein n=1 Tax=Paenibacillus haidiansis TaxID=1574488 RepID=A0ABU7VUD5_9BACL
MKHLANMISISRMILLILLFFLTNHVWMFLLVYLLCGLSDVLDGYIARKTKTQSDLGARLDSAADLLLFGVITVAMIVWLKDEALIFLPWIILIVTIRCANLLISARKYHSFAIVHTWGNKVSGFLLFMTPPLYFLFQNPAVAWPVCLVSVLSALEETAIHLTSAKLDLNRQSIFKH